MIIHTFPRALKEEPDNEDLQSSHTDHHPIRYYAEFKDPRLRALDSTEISIFPRPEVFLIAVDCRQIA